MDRFVFFKYYFLLFKKYHFMYFKNTYPFLKWQFIFTILDRFVFFKYHFLLFKKYQLLYFKISRSFLFTRQIRIFLIPPLQIFFIHYHHLCRSFFYHLLFYSLDRFIIFYYNQNPEIYM